jgi:hypothetical protein
MVFRDSGVMAVSDDLKRLAAQDVVYLTRRILEDGLTEVFRGAATAGTQRQLGIQRVHGSEWCCWLRSGPGSVFVDFRRVPEYRHSGLHFLHGWSGGRYLRNYFTDDADSVRFYRIVWRSFQNRRNSPLCSCVSITLPASS